MEEELAGDLAEQCQGGLGEDDHLQEATPEMFEHTVSVAEKVMSCDLPSPLQAALFRSADRVTGTAGCTVGGSEEKVPVATCECCLS